MTADASPIARGKRNAAFRFPRKETNDKRKLLMARRHPCLLVLPKRQAEPELLAAQPGRQGCLRSNHFYKHLASLERSRMDPKPVSELDSRA